MKTAAQKTLFKAFNESSVKNGIKEFGSKMKQARWSGSNYRTAIEAQERRNLAERFNDDLMKPYQDTYRNQVPAILLAMGDKKALDKVILKKLRLAENEQRLARYLLESQTKGIEWLMVKWTSFRKEMSDEEAEHYEAWLKEFLGTEDEEPQQKNLFV